MLKMLKPGFSETTLNSLNNEDHQHFQGLVQCSGSSPVRIGILDPIQYGFGSCILSGTAPDTGSSRVKIRFEIHLRFHSFF